MKHTNVAERVYEKRRLLEAWQQVKQNGGVAGIDNMTVNDFEERKRELFPIIYNKLREGKYKFKPVKRVLIPKEGGKVRKLGIPVVMDRIVAQSINTVLEEIFDKEFSQSNYGFRKGRNQHQAIKHVQQAVKEGKTWGVSIDLKSFFDEIPHNLILKLIRRKIKDERFVTLIARVLKSGVIEEGKFKKVEKGVPQGSPSSPIISNIVLNEMDQELEQRGLRFCRWADDFVILLSSERAGIRVMKGIAGYLESELKLPVNKEKSKVARIKDITFLGIKILREKIRISEKAIKKFKIKLRELTKRNNPLSMYKIIIAVNEFLRGWINYFRIQEFKKILETLDEWIRSRLRSMQLKKWKKPSKFQRIMIKQGWDVEKAKRTWIRMNRWQSVNRREVKFVLNLKWFREMGIIFLADYIQSSS
jgi:group II intron reverse transcriptase/maturase